MSNLSAVPPLLNQATFLALTPYPEENLQWLLREWNLSAAFIDIGPVLGSTTAYYIEKTLQGLEQTCPVLCSIVFYDGRSSRDICRSSFGEHTGCPVQ
jgi:hypothetical protein